MGSPLKDKTTCWQLSVVIKMDFCVEVKTNSIRDGADRRLQAAAAGGAQADKAVAHKAVLCDILILLGSSCSGSPGEAR